jgi:hypothetical protein
VTCSSLTEYYIPCLVALRNDLLQELSKNRRVCTGHGGGWGSKQDGPPLCPYGLYYAAVKPRRPRRAHEGVIDSPTRRRPDAENSHARTSNFALQTGPASGRTLASHFSRITYHCVAEGALGLQTSPFKLARPPAGVRLGPLSLRRPRSRPKSMASSEFDSSVQNLNNMLSPEFPGILPLYIENVPTSPCHSGESSIVRISVNPFAGSGAISIDAN